jgi:hypothetical protein
MDPRTFDALLFEACRGYQQSSLWRKAFGFSAKQRQEYRSDEIVPGRKLGSGTRGQQFGKSTADSFLSMAGSNPGMLVLVAVPGTVLRPKYL